MTNKDFNIKFLEEQELNVKNQTESFYGKNRKGFCDFTLQAIELFIIGLSNSEKVDIVEDSDLRQSHKFLALLHYKRVCYSFKSTYNIFLNGYYSDAAIILRSIIETFVRLKFIEKKGNTKSIFQILSGHYGYKGEKNRISHETHFNTVSKGLYEYYRLLCDMTHGSLGPHLLMPNSFSGLDFQELNSTFISNQYAVYLLAHIEYFHKIFPECYNKYSDENRQSFNEVKAILWNVMSEISKKEKNQDWYNVSKKLIEY